VKKVLEDIFVLLLQYTPSLGVCCPKLSIKHPGTEYNNPEERKCQLHIFENMKTRKVLEDATRESFRRIFVTSKMTMIINTQALGGMSLAF
jgi:hypothetical protein